MNDIPQNTGLAGLTLEVKDVEQKLEALEAASATAAPPPATAMASAPAVSASAPATPAPATVNIPDAPAPSPTFAASDTPLVSVTPEQLSALRAAKQKADDEAATKEFYDRILAARTAPNEADKPAPVQPVAPQILAQTRAEMAAGQAAVAKHAAERAANPPPPVKPDGTMTPVFRPPDYVPDQAKGQGNVTNTVLR